STERGGADGIVEESLGKGLLLRDNEVARLDLARKGGGLLPEGQVARVDGAPPGIIGRFQSGAETVVELGGRSPLGLGVEREGGQAEHQGHREQQKAGGIHPPTIPRSPRVKTRKSSGETPRAEAPPPQSP